VRPRQRSCCHGQWVIVMLPVGVPWRGGFSAGGVAPSEQGSSAGPWVATAKHSLKEPTAALSQSGVPDLLDAFRAIYGVDLIRESRRC